MVGIIMKTVQEFIDAGILIQSDIDNKYISQANIDHYNRMSDKELKECYELSMQYFTEDFHSYIYHQKDLRELDDDEFWYRNGAVDLGNRVMNQILAERLEDTESTLDDMINIVNLQEHEGDEEYFKEIDKLYARIKTLKAEG